jgi:hypothetical protein
MVHISTATAKLSAMASLLIQMALDIVDHERSDMCATLLQLDKYFLLTGQRHS